MKKNISRLFSLILLMMLFLVATPAYADETTDDTATSTNGITTSISITPLQKVLVLNSGRVYEDSFTVSNNGGEDMKVETYAAPYSYVYSETEDKYNLGFSTESSYTQISRWITFQDTSGQYVERPTFVIAPNSSLEIHYKITTPSSIPAGGQYAVIFAHTLTSTTSASGIRTEASPGIIVYGRSNEGETITEASISKLTIDKTYVDNTGITKNNFCGSAKVMNNGNTDFVAHGILKVTGLFGDVRYETGNNDGIVSIIPDSELEVTDSWEETPEFGFFRVTWTVTAADKSETTHRVILLMSPIAIIITIIILTSLIIGIIIFIKKHKESRSRCAI